MPAMSPLFSLFGRSPIKPIQKHMSVVLDCTNKLLPFIMAVYNKNWEQAKKLQTELRDLEHQADNLKKEIRQRLPNGLFLPVPRSDLLNMLRTQDKIANKAKDIAGIILGRTICFPEPIEDIYKNLLLKSLASVEQARQAIDELDELLETGFRGKEVNIVEDMIHKLDDIEHETDDIQIKLRQDLYKIEKELSPIDVMFLYQVIQWTGELADQAQRVGSQLQLLIAN
ncbi:MAG: TIGR00153 family protein [Gammaproteobacteria bacterium]|nr:TIGR00153 family protein [Gammaproteobacteria bacterium]